MNLRGKFNSMLVVVFGMALGASGYFSYQQLNANARDEVLSNAGVLMETILSARTWAVNEVGPNLRETEEDEEMLMMGIPAYAANKVMEAVQKRYPEYGYREVALNPTRLPNGPRRHQRCHRGRTCARKSRAVFVDSSIGLAR